MPAALPFFPSVPLYQVSTTLEGVQYVFDVRWNGRARAWYFDISTEDGSVIQRAVKVVLGAPLAKRVADARMPPGVLFAIDTTDTGTEAGLNDLGTRVQVQYYTLDEIAAL